MAANWKHVQLRERAAAFSVLIREPGWKLLEQIYRPRIRGRITDADDREAFLYEAVRAQVIQEIFEAPGLVIRQAEREGSKNPCQEHPADLERAELE